MVYAVTETYGAYDKRNKGEVGSSEKKLFGTRRRNGGRRSKYTVGNIPAGNGNGMYRGNAPCCGGISLLFLQITIA